MALNEDRRSVAIRLSVLQYAHRPAVLGPGRELLGAAGRPERKVRGAGRKQQSAHARAAGSARRGVRPPRPGAGRESSLLQHFDCPRAHEGPEPHRPPARLAARVRGARRARDRRSPSPRADLSANPDRARRDAAPGGRRHGEASRAAGRRHRGRSDQAVSRHDGRAPVRIRRRGQRRADRRRRHAEERGHRRPVGDREDLQQPADGRRRREGRRGQQRRTRDPHARRTAARPKASASS